MRQEAIRSFDIDGKGFETVRDRAMAFMKTYGDDIETFKGIAVTKDEWFMKQCLAIASEGSDIQAWLTDMLMELEKYKPPVSEK